MSAEEKMTIEVTRRVVGRENGVETLWFGATVRSELFRCERTGVNFSGSASACLTAADAIREAQADLATQLRADARLLDDAANDVECGMSPFPIEEGVAR